MKVIAALLLGLISSIFADSDTDSVVLEFESPDSADVSEGDDAVSYNGLIIQVRQSADESPTIALGSDLDNYDDVYCLNFVGFFEASDYDLTTSTSGDYTEIDDTRFDLADANCTTFQEDDIFRVFTIKCTDIEDATLFLTFSFVEDEQGDFGLEYTIRLQDYELSDDATNLVMVQSLNECGDLVDIDAESEEDTEDTEDTETDDTDDTDTETDDTDDTDIVSEGGRRLLDDTTEEPDEADLDSELDNDETDEEDTEDTEDTETDDTDEETDEESLDESAGISEDDSGEFDTGFARFVVNAQALDSCDNGDSTTTNTNIESSLVFQKDDDELHIVFGRFDCTLVLDPFYGLDESKYETVYGVDATPSPIDDNAQSFTIFIASVIGLIAYLW